MAVQDKKAKRPSKGRDVGLAYDGDPHETVEEAYAVFLSDVIFSGMKWRPGAIVTKSEAQDAYDQFRKCELIPKAYGGGFALFQPVIRSGEEWVPLDVELPVDVTSSMQHVIRILSERGILKKQHSAFVPSVTPKEVQDLFALRDALDKYVAMQFIKLADRSENLSRAWKKITEQRQHYDAYVAAIAKKQPADDEEKFYLARLLNHLRRSDIEMHVELSRGLPDFLQNTIRAAHMLPQLHYEVLAFKGMEETEKAAIFMRECIQEHIWILLALTEPWKQAALFEAARMGNTGPVHGFPDWLTVQEWKAARDRIKQLVGDELFERTCNPGREGITWAQLADAAVGAHMRGTFNHWYRAKISARIGIDVEAFPTLVLPPDLNRRMTTAELVGAVPGTAKTKERGATADKKPRQGRRNGR